MPKVARIMLPLLFIAAVYGSGVLVETVWPDASDSMVAVWIGAVLVVGVANVINACLDRGEGSPRRLAFWDILLKLCMIPFYLLVFTGGFAASIAMAVVPGFILFAPIMVLLLAAIDYVLLLLTSSYGFVSVVRARRQGLITSTSMVVLAVLHALFVTDVVAAIILHAKVRKAERALASEGFIPTA